MSKRHISISATNVHRWKPKEDITAYELALILPIFGLVASNPNLSYQAERMIAELPEGAARHLEVDDGG